MRIHFPVKCAPILGAHASRVLANASSRWRTFGRASLAVHTPLMGRLFRRDAETNTRDACPSQDAPCR